MSHGGDGGRPPGYALVLEPDFGEDEPLGVCHEVEGLFSDPPEQERPHYQ